MKVLIGDSEVQDALKELDDLTAAERTRTIAETWHATKFIAKNITKIGKDLNKTVEMQKKTAEDVNEMQRKLGMSCHGVVSFAASAFLQSERVLQSGSRQ
jgi:dihydroxyacetone kinase